MYPSVPRRFVNIWQRRWMRALYCDRALRNHEPESLALASSRIPGNASFFWNDATIVTSPCVHELAHPSERTHPLPVMDSLR